MCPIGSKNPRLTASPGTSHICRLGVELLGGNHYLLVSAALRFVAGDNIAMAEVSEAWGYELTFPGLQGPIGVYVFNGENLAVNKSGLTIVAANENLVTGADLHGSWQRDREFLRTPTDINRTVAAFKPYLARFNPINRESLSTRDGTNTRIECDQHARPIICGIALLLICPIQLLMNGNYSPVAEQVPLFETFANCFGKSVVLFPGGGNSDTLI